MTVELIDLRGAERDDTGGIGRFAEHDGDALDGRSDLERPHHELHLVGGDDLRGLVDGHAADFPADDDGSARVVETLETRLSGRQRTEPLARSQRNRGRVRHEAGEVAGDEDRLADGGRVVAAGHQVHLRGELARPGADRTTQVEVVSDALLAVVAEADRQTLEAGRINRAILLLADADGPEDPLARGLRDRRGDGGLLRGLLGLTEEQADRKEQGDEGRAHGGIHRVLPLAWARYFRQKKGRGHAGPRPDFN